MQGALIILGFTIIVGILLYLFDRKSGVRDSESHGNSGKKDLKSENREAAQATAYPENDNAKGGIAQDMTASGEGDARREIAQDMTASGKGDADGSNVVDGEDENGECCGMHLVCEKTSLSPVSPEIEYFDDEELDRFSGRGEDSYSDEEIEEFLDVLLTMRAAEVASWSRSLQLRSIIPPVSVRDQILLIVSEQRIQQ